MRKVELSLKEKEKYEIIKVKSLIEALATIKNHL